MSGRSPAQPPIILLVEDEPGIRESLELLLELEGFSVVSAANPLQAVEKRRSRDGDLSGADQLGDRRGRAFVAQPPHE